MIRIGVVGGTGKLGSLIIAAILADRESAVGAVIGRPGNKYIGRDLSELIGVAGKGIIITDNIREASLCDCYIDCTNAENFMNSNYDMYAELKKPVLVATTGFDASGMDKLRDLSMNMPVLQSGNFSMALHDFLETVRFAASRMQEKADISIIEYHHDQKKDAPSGTAKMIRDAICEANPLYQEKDISISSIRGGSIVGEHQVLFAYCDETMEFWHKVSSRETFAYGALKVCKWLAAQDNGFYELKDYFNRG